MLVVQSCRTLCNPMNCSLPDSSVHGILQARILEWIAIPFSRGSSWPKNWTWVSCIVCRFFTVWATREVPLGNQIKPKHLCVCSVMSDSLQLHGLQPARLLCPWNFPGKNTGVGCHFLLPGIEPASLASPALTGGFFTTSATWEAPWRYKVSSP